MPRNFSLWLLFAMIAAIGILFFKVVQPFIIALFVAVVLAVLFTPVHQRLCSGIGGRNRIAAVITTLLVLLLVLLPISVTLLMAGTQVMEVGKDFVTWFDERSPENIDETLDEIDGTAIGRRLNDTFQNLSEAQKQQIRASVSRLTEGVTAEFYDKTRSILSDVFTFLVGFSVMTLALYYFLADRNVFLREVHRMIPLNNREEEQLTAEFQSVCSGVVLGTVVAGIVQAALAGIGFAVLGVPHVWMLTVFAMFCSFIPFVGSALVWISVAIYLLIEQRYGAAIGLTIYGGAIIATADNLVRAYVIGNRARLHPLVALVTVLGALKLMGLWGIFVGPMVAAVLYALLNIARERFAGSRTSVDGQLAKRKDSTPVARENSLQRLHFS